MSDITHTLTPQTKLDACCDPGSARYALRAVEVIPSGEPGTVYCAASDGKVAVVIQVKGEAQGIALLPAKLAKLRKPVTLNGRWECDGKVANPVEGRFPRMEDVLPAVPADDLANYVTVVLKGHQMKAIADSISEEGILTFFIPPNGQKGYVDRAIACRGTHGLGVIMPTTPDKDEHEKYETLRQRYAAARRWATRPQPAAEAVA